MIIPGQRSLPQSVHNRFVITFTNTLFHINWLRRIFRRISSSLLEQTTEQHTRFWVRHNTTDSRHQCSCCQRSPTMFAVFLHCTAVLNCVRATHGLPADRAPVYRGCPCRDPLGCPLIPRQNGIRGQSANPLAAALN